MATFKPVKEVDAPQEGFNPVREVPGVSTVTGERAPDKFEQTKSALNKYKQAAATGVRYGVPVAAGTLTGGMSFGAQAAIGGLTAAGAEISARQLERLGTDPEFDDLWKDIQSGGIAGAADVAGTLAMKGFSKGILKTARGLMFRKRAIPPEVEMAQAVLGTKAGAAQAKKWWKWTGEDPFSLSLHQMNPDEKGFIYHLEAVARSGVGAGKFKKFDERNVRHVQEVLSSYIQKRATQSTGPGFAGFVNRVLGKTNKPGELFKPVLAYRTHLYEQYKDALGDLSHKMQMSNSPGLDVSDLRSVIKGTKDQRMRDVYQDLRMANLLPPLNDTKAWKNVDVLNVDEAIHQMNGLYNGAKTADAELFNRRLNYMSRHLRDPYDKFLKDKPGLKTYKDAANKFYGKEQDMLHNTVITSIRKQLIDKPSTVIDLIKPTIGKPGASYDTLMRMKEALKFSAETPGTPEKAISGMGIKAAQQEWENGVLRPLRFEFVAGSTDNQGIFQAGKILKKFERIENSGMPQLLNEVWGGPRQVTRIKELLKTMDYIQNTTTGNSIWLQLKTMAAMSAGGMGVWSFMANDNPKQAVGGIAGAAMILMSPNALAKVMANPRMTRALYEGFSEKRVFTGIGPKLSLALRKIGQMKAATEVADNQFYRFRPVAPEEPEENGM